MNTEFLRSFLDVVETGSFTRSACRLHVSQSTISGRVQELEREVGQTLLTIFFGGFIEQQSFVNRKHPFIDCSVHNQPAFSVWLVMMWLKKPNGWSCS